MWQPQTKSSNDISGSGYVDKEAGNGMDGLNGMIFESDGGTGAGPVPGAGAGPGAGGRCAIKFAHRFRSSIEYVTRISGLKQKVVMTSIDRFGYVDKKLVIMDASRG
uniref:Uncharacterized protein n=1 Tax=Panagrolaimus sp. JU765 TaxID=591449 RepID=A0AC34R6V9_9BILA